MALISLFFWTALLIFDFYFCNWWKWASTGSQLSPTETLMFFYNKKSIGEQYKNAFNLYFIL